MEQHIQTASFVEMVVVNPTQVSNPDFDIIFDEKVTLQNYCNALIEIIFTLKLTQYPAFINYQTNLVKKPIAWLNKLASDVHQMNDKINYADATCLVSSSWQICKVLATIDAATTEAPTSLKKVPWQDLMVMSG